METAFVTDINDERMICEYAAWGGPGEVSWNPGRMERSGSEWFWNPTRDKNTVGILFVRFILSCVMPFSGLALTNSFTPLHSGVNPSDDVQMQGRQLWPDVFEAIPKIVAPDQQRQRQLREPRRARKERQG